MDDEWLCRKLENLKIKENRLTTLTEIHGRLNETPNLEAKVTDRLLSSPEIYNCLNDDGDEYNRAANDAKPTDLVIDILCICMGNLPLKGKNDLPCLLHRALLHKRSRIRALALNAILKQLHIQMADNNDGSKMTDIISMELLHHILLALQDPEVELGHTASKILCIVLEYYLNESSVKDTLLKALKKGDVVKCRLYELAVELGNRSSASLEKVEFILDHALGELDNDDVLLQVNILEILAALAKQNHGLSYLEKRQVFEVLGKRIEEMEHNPIDRLLIPGIIKFFGKVSSVQPQKVISGYPHMIRCLFECLNSDDVALLPTAFDTLANLTQTEQGVLYLENNYATAMMDVFKTYSNLLTILPTDLKIRAFDSLKHIFTFEDTFFPEVSFILQRWFNFISNGTNKMQFLMDFCRNPFPDIKTSALNFIHSVCSYSWGIEALKNTAGFLEFLLDRNVEFDKDAKYTKFCIISILANSEAFDVQTNVQLRTYVNEGPYFVPVIMEVAIEGNE